MRLTMVTHAYPRHAGDPAGAFIARLAAALASRGHTVRVILPTDEGRAGPAEQDGVALTWVRYDTPERETLAYRGTMATALRSPRGLWGVARLIRALGRAVRAGAPATDVVHAQWWVPAGVAVARGLPRTVPYVVTLHGTDVAMLERVPLARRLARHVFRRAARVTAVSRFLGERARAATGLIRPVVVQPMPWVPAPPPPPDAASRRAVFVGRLSAQKRVAIAVEALTHLPPDVTLTIAGDGPERAALERLARPLGARVRFLGAVAPDRVPDVLAQAGVFVFPADREGYGLAVAEALQQGVPVVAATDGGGAADIVTPGAGLLAAPTPTAFAAAMRGVLADPDARTQARAAGRALAARLSPDAVAAAYEGIYQAALA